MVAKSQSTELFCQKNVRVLNASQFAIFQLITSSKMCLFIFNLSLTRKSVEIFMIYRCKGIAKRPKHKLYMADIQMFTKCGKVKKKRKERLKRTIFKRFE